MWCAIRRDRQVILRASIGGLVLCLFCTLTKADETQEATTQQSIANAVQAFRQGNAKDAIATLNGVLAANPDQVAALATRGQIHESTGDMKQAIADYTRWAKLKSDSSQPFNARGGARFKAGDVVGSVADFDQAIKNNPGLERSHWQRGLSHYYAGKFKEGDKQFELYQTYHSADVENVVWRMACQARYLGFEKAQQNIMKLGGRDRRVPMSEIDALFRGDGTAEQVLVAAKSGEPDKKTLNERLFYAHLYLGLFHEIKGEHAQAREHILAADKHKIGHYMWDVAHVHAEILRKKTTKSASAPD